MKTSMILRRAILILVAPITVVSCVSAPTRIVAVNQIGYPRVFTKFAFSNQAADSFAVVRNATGESVFRGPMALWRSSDAATGLTVYRGDFTALQEAGLYRVTTSRGDTSSLFAIGDSVYDVVFRSSLKGFYLQRCGMALIAAYAGLYQHASCHALDGGFHSSTDTSGFHVATGGWHDAGDYGKYVVNAGISAGTLLLAYEMFPSRFNSDDLGIPESGNGVPDILDEVRYEIQWFLTMQRGDGGFWFKVTRAQFEGFIMPQNDTGARNIYEVSSTATGDAVAVLARAARLFAGFDSAFAQTCLNAAILGWEYLAANPDIVPAGGFRNPSGTVTGEYGDGNDTDERLWAAAELFETTGGAVYHDAFQGGLIFGSQFGTMWWGDVRSLALLTYLRSTQPASLTAVKTDLRQSLEAYCTAQLAKRNNSGYQTVLHPGDYVWGSNSVALNAAVLLLVGGTETGNSAFVDVAADQLHYVLGVNGLSRSYITGLGENPPRQPHHRPSAADGVANPVPGLLAGGPNQNRQDPVLEDYFQYTTPPALCYLDTLPSYASNEIAINWNAPLVFVAGYFRGFSGSTDVRWGNQLAPPGYMLEQNFPNPFNPATLIKYAIAGTRGQGPEASNVRLVMYDVLGREVEVLVDEEQGPGTYDVWVDAAALSTGVYFYRLTTGQFTKTRKMIVAR